MTDILKDYTDALERLKNNKPLKVPMGTKITNDSVSLEAGRKKGTIKKSRPVFSELIEAIDDAAKSQSKPDDDMRQQLDKAKSEITRYRALWEEALAREVSLIKQLWDERDARTRERAAHSKSSITPIKNSRRT